MRIRPDAFEACAKKISERGRLTDQEAKDLLQEVASRAERMRLSGEADPFVTAAGELAQNLKDRAKADRLDALRNAAIRNKKLSDIKDAGGIKQAFRLLQSDMHYVPGAANLENTESQWHALSRAWRAPLGNRLRQEGLTKVAVSGALDDQISEAVWRANGGAPNKDVVISSQAQTMADAMHAPLEIAKDRQNNAGARIGDALDHVTHTNWDPRQLRLAAGPRKTPEEAFAAWWKAERPRMAAKTFDHLIPEDWETSKTQAQAEEKFGRSVFFSGITGVHMHGPGAIGAGEVGGGYVPPAFEGSRNLAKSVSHQRVVFWKDSQSWLAHMREFGGGDSLYAQVDRTLDTSARRVALMEKWGTNPIANLNLITRRLQESYRNADPDAVNEFGKKIQRLQNTMGRLDGSLNIPVNADFHQAVEMLQTLEATAHLGGVAITHLTAAPMTVSAELAAHGIPHLQGVAKVLQAITSGRGAPETQAIMADAGAYTHGYHMALQAHLRPDGGVPGYMSWGAARFMQLTGLDRFIDGLQAKAVKGMLMGNLGRQADKELANVEPHVANMLRAYGIREDDWNLLRQTADPLKVEGQRWMTPRDVSAIPDALIEGRLRANGALAVEAAPEAVSRAVQNYRWQLGDKLLMYLNDAAERGTVTPGVREKAMTYGATRPGSFDYTLRRFMLQFKMWPLAAVNQIWQKSISQSLSRKEVAQNLGWIVALSTAGGALRMAVNDVASGRPQRDYRSPTTALAAFAQGGGLGIYGDFLFGETNRMSNTLAATVMGPVAGDAERLLQIYDNFRRDIGETSDPTATGPRVPKRGRFSDLWPELARFGIGHIPFANLIYLKGALSYLMWFHVYEAMSPGFWERTNRRLQREQGRTMQGYTPGGGVPTGLPYLYMKNQAGQSFGLFGQGSQP